MEPKRIIRVIFFSFSVAILFAGSIYLAVFGRALGQRESHIGIALALPRVIWGSHAVRVDDKTYLARDSVSFVKEMESRGFKFVEQMGAGYLFEKDGAGYMSIGRMYSSQFMLFSKPVENGISSFY
jgi:hypothetical protein